jgi:transposase
MIVNYQGIVIGIDIGKYQHVAVALMPDGTFNKPLKISNDLTGYEDFLSRIIQLKKECRTEQVIVGMESTGHYSEVPARWLTSKGIRVVQVNALHTKRAKEIEDNSPGKTDAKDARIIAQLVRYGKYLACVLPEGAFADLRELIRMREHLCHRTDREAQLPSPSPRFGLPGDLHRFQEVVGKDASSSSRSLSPPRAYDRCRIDRDNNGSQKTIP